MHPVRDFGPFYTKPDSVSRFNRRKESSKDVDIGRNIKTLDGFGTPSEMYLSQPHQHQHQHQYGHHHHPAFQRGEPLHLYDEQDDPYANYYGPYVNHDAWMMQRKAQYFDNLIRFTGFVMVLIVILLIGWSYMDGIVVSGETNANTGQGSAETTKGFLSTKKEKILFSLNIVVLLITVFVSVDARFMEGKGMKRIFSLFFHVSRESFIQEIYRRVSETPYPVQEEEGESFVKKLESLLNYNRLHVDESDHEEVQNFARMFCDVVFKYYSDNDIPVTRLLRMNRKKGGAVILDDALIKIVSIIQRERPENVVKTLVAFSELDMDPSFRKKLLSISREMYLSH